VRPIPPLHLPCISPYLPCISPVNWQRALDAVRPVSPLQLPCITPLHLPPQVRERRDPLCSLARSDSSNLDAVFEHHLTLTLTLTLNPQP